MNHAVSTLASLRLRDFGETPERRETAPAPRAPKPIAQPNGLGSCGFVTGLADLVEDTRQVVVTAVESMPAGFTVPLKVEVKAGRTWAECK